MKFSSVVLSTLAATAAAQQRPDAQRMAKIRNAQNVIRTGVRSDGNALLIQQMLEFYLSFSGQDTSNVEAMLSYGCYCQLLVQRKEGKGEPMDKFDEICLKYQQCTKCVEADNPDFTTQEGKDCSWENGRYEIAFDSGTNRMGCPEAAADGECGATLCQCDEQLAFELSENANAFKAKFATPNGFEFDDKCIPTKKPGTVPGPGRGDLQCCGSYPTRFPFHDQNGGRDCCVDKVYSTSAKKCCRDGSLVGYNKKC
jgi:hypothetical protein